jgi:hypothetical protein
MGVDRFARHLGLLGAMQLVPPPLGIELDDPRLDRDAACPETAARIPLPPTIVTLAKKQGDDFCATAPRIEPAACPSLATGTRTRLAANPVGISASPPDGHLNLFQERLGPEIAARIDPDPAATNSSRPHMKLVALILCHELTILIACASRKSRKG